MSLSVGQLHSARQLLDLVAARAMSPKALTDGLSSILVCPVVDVLNLSAKCGWVEIDLDGNLRSSVRGSRIQEEPDFELRLREQMLDIISALQPAWAKMIPRGRSELLKFLPSDVSQCFFEAGLLNSPPVSSVVKWWDDLAERARGLTSSYLNQIGRAGEKLSIAYENERTGRLPRWQAVESNLSGYDILSVKSATDDTPLQVEVKASEQTIESAVLHLSASEWEVAISSRAHHFHLWLLSNPPLLATLENSDIGEHVPSNSGAGNWKGVAIPFLAFRPRFQSVVRIAHPFH